MDGVGGLDGARRGGWSSGGESGGSRSLGILPCHLHRC